MENNEKIYIGSGKEKFEGSLVEATINLSKIMKTCKDFIFEYGGDKYIKLKVVKKKQEDQYGKSHYVEVDTWKPASAEDKGLSYGEPDKVKQPDEELPF